MFALKIRIKHIKIVLTKKWFKSIKNFLWMSKFYVKGQCNCRCLQLAFESAFRCIFFHVYFHPYLLTLHIISITKI